MIKLLATVATLWVPGYWVMAVAPPGVASADAAYAHPKTTKYAPFPDSLYHVVGAGWLIAAVAPEKRGYKPLVEANGEDQYFSEPFLHDPVGLLS